VQSVQTLPGALTPITQADVDMVMPLMDNFLKITAKSVADGFNLVVTRAFQIDQIEQMLASNPALGNVFTRR